MLVTEKPGRLRVVATTARCREPVAGLPAVDARGQGGLLDVALDPAFATNRLIYWSYAEPRDGGMNNTAVARGKFVDGAAPRVENVQVIYHQAPSLDVARCTSAAGWCWTRDGTLFITQGERSITEGRMQAQSMDGLLGKIVRINADGSIPKDNPFVGKEGVRPEIWSFGHRNVQAAALQPDDRRAVGSRARHARRRRDQHRAQGQGLRLADDRLRHRVPGRPDHRRHHSRRTGMEQPVYYWDPVIAPSGMIVLHGQAVPGVEGQPLRRRPRHDEPRAPRREGREGRRRRAAADRICSRSASDSATCVRDPTARSTC